MSINDDRSPLLDLMICIVCDQTMKLEKIDPDDGGNNLIQYRCKLCGRIERLALRPGRPRTRSFGHEHYSSSPSKKVRAAMGAIVQSW